MNRLPNEDAVQTRQTELLHAIASVLHLPVAAFLEPDGESAAASAEACELLMTFTTILDADARARCLAFVRTTAGPDLAARKR